MKILLNYAFGFTLLCLSACQVSEELPDVKNAIPEVQEAPRWEVPLQLSEDWESDLKALDALAEIKREQADSPVRKNRRVAFLDAGSVDELQDKIDRVGRGGTVVLKRGNHYESTTVTASNRVNIVGLPGAILHSGVRNVFTAGSIEPAIHVIDADYSVIAGIKFASSIGPQEGGVALLIENSHYVISALNQVNGFLSGIMLDQSDHNYVLGNRISVSDIAIAQFFDGHGIVVVNGDYCNIKWINISKGIFGIWAADKNGLVEHNFLHENYVGLILCNIPAQSYPLPGGNVVGSDFPGAKYTVKNNTAWSNLDAGYMVSDGANNNLLRNNRAFGNGTFGIDLLGDSYRFGFLAPTSFDNTVIAGRYNVTIKDCGRNNTVNGGTQIDITAEPCF